MKKIFALFLIVALLMSLTACGSDTAQETASAETYTFTDDAGRQVQIPTQISRIVPSSALGQMILQAIAPEMLVGLSSAIAEEARGYIYDSLFDLPEFGNLYSMENLNIEELALANPQLIIDLGEKKPSTIEDMDALQKQTLIPSIFLSTSLESMPETFRTLGKLLGKEEKGEQLAQFCEKVYHRTVSVMEQVGENKVKALYVLGEDGLNVIAASSYHAELLDLLTDNLAVVENPISKGSGTAVTMEQIVLWDPEFVIFGPDSIYGTVRDRSPWNQMAAIVNGNFVEVPNLPDNWMSMPPSVQRYLGLIWLTAVLYPQYCDYDVREDILEYYSLFNGCALTDEQYAKVTANAFLP